MLRFILPLVLAIAASADAAFLRYPDVHGDRIVFMYAGDLWTASTAGGAARRLTSHAGYEYLPRFSPDGRTIAFSAEYGGNLDVYAMPSSGGPPKRLTYHPTVDRVNGWTPDGRIAFRSKRTSIVPNYDRLFTVGIDGGMPDELPMPSAGTSSFSPDGTKIAYNRVSRETFFWKRYRGGTQSWITIFDLKTHAVTEVPHTDAGDIFPMWFGNAIYFVSDRDGVMNLWRYDIGTKEIRQLTRHTELDIKFPALASDGSGRIAYENGGRIFLFDIAKETTSEVPINVASDAPTVLPRIVETKKWITSFGLSPSGARAVIAARGEVFTVPAKVGETRDLTNTSGARELSPAWSPDGKWIAYVSDRTGEYELYVRAQDGRGEERKLTTLGAGIRAGLLWSPDSTRLLFRDQTQAIYLLGINGGAPVLIDRSDYSAIEEYDFSPDGQWIAYAKAGANDLARLFVYALATKKSTAVTDGLTDDTSPQFDRAGKILWFLSKRTFNPEFSQFEKTFSFRDSVRIYAMMLRAADRSPFAPKSDEEGAAEAPKSTDIKTTIDFEGIERRVVPVPVDAGSYHKLRAREGTLFYLASANEKETLKAFDVAEKKERDVIAGIGDYDLDREGKKIIYRLKEKLGIVDASATSKVGDGALALETMTMRLEPRAEWSQIFHEAWRMERDLFYDPTMRGVDWPAMLRRYEPELQFVSIRNDVNTLIGEMNGELGVSHITAYGGDVADATGPAAGLLGADYEVANDRIRFRRIYRGDNSSEATRAPLAVPGITVREGDYLLAINGRPLTARDDVASALEGAAGHEVRLLVNDRATSEGAREVLVVPVASEAEIRYRDWVSMNRRKVLAATDGRCAYIHLPDTQTRGIAEFGRTFYAQSDKDCVVVDARWNNGGEIPDFFFEHLARRHLEYDAPRYGADLEYQRPAILGPKVLVINEYAGSGGDSVADYFRKYALGPIIGKRTWGGLMGIGGELPMIDGGRVTVPFISAWDVVDGKSTWIVENRGVDPDIEVDDRPDLVLAGHDPQLEKGIELVKAALAKMPPKPKRPSYGKHWP